jgi:hypothetical protein
VYRHEVKGAGMERAAFGLTLSRGMSRPASRMFHDSLVASQLSLPPREQKVHLENTWGMFPVGDLA